MAATQGKLLNVTDASAQKLAENKEIGYLKQILGLKHSFKYTEPSQLRYGRVLIASDADVDGSHISKSCCARSLSSHEAVIAPPARLLTTHGKYE